MAMTKLLSRNTKTILSITIVALLCVTAVFAYSTFGNYKLPELTVTAIDGETLQALTGGCYWRFGFNIVQANSISPLDFDYKSENTMTVEKGSLLTISSKRTTLFGYRDFTAVSLNRYRSNEEQVEIRTFDFQDGALLQNAPEEKGEYLYSLRLKYRQGSVDYGFKVIVTDNSELSDVSTDGTTIGNSSDSLYSFPMKNHLHTFRFDGADFTPIDDFMLQDTVVSDLDASVYFKVDDLCAYARELSGLLEDQINKIEIYENAKTVDGNRYINLIDLHDVVIYTFVGWEYSSHTPVSFFTNEPDVTTEMTS